MLIEGLKLATRRPLQISCRSTGMAADWQWWMPSSCVRMDASLGLNIPHTEGRCEGARAAAVNH